LTTAPPAAPQKPSWLTTELGLRVVSAIVLAALTLLVTYLGGWPFLLLWTAAAVAISLEWSAMAGLRPLLRLRMVLVAGLVAMAAAPHLGARWGMVASVALIAAGLLAAIGERMRDRLWSIAGFGCAALLVVVLPLMREDPRIGMTGIFWIFAVVWCTDIAAYFTGRRLGGPKLWPRVSPKKTWSGFAGGLAAGTLAGTAVVLIASRYAGWHAPMGGAAVAAFSALASIVGQAGDLAESALKRHSGIKDSGHVIPGHGGVMDRLDALWAVTLLCGVGLLGMRALQP
jgi:phosphatidate cytidylyltransferase